jgi:hypothetical protein
MNEDLQSGNKTTTTSSVSSVTAMTSTTTTAAPLCEGSTEDAMNPRRQRVLEFFSNEIERYVIGDLMCLSEVRPDQKTGLRGCAVPQAMLAFAILDLFGYLINEKSKARKDDTHGNFKEIFSSKHGLFPVPYEKETDRIVELFRHGMMHQFFAKASAVAKLGEDAPLILFQDAPCLNVDRLSEDVITALRELRQRVASGDYDDLAERINGRLDRLAKEDSRTRGRLCP